MTPPTAPSVPAGAEGTGPRPPAGAGCRQSRWWPGPPSTSGRSPLSGTRGAGTVFFSGRSLGCVFCQNQAISQADFGKTISVDRLRAIFQELVAQGAHNIDLVNPTHFAHVVAQALEAPPDSCGVEHRGDMTGWRPSRPWKENRHLPPRLQVPPTPQGGQDLRRGGRLPGGGPGGHPGDGPPNRALPAGRGWPAPAGVVIRHLLLPGRLAQAKEVMDWVAGTFPRGRFSFPS